jgi:hypothetical protein
MQHINILIERILHKFLMEEVESVPTFLIKCGKLRVSLQLIEISNTMSFSLEYIYTHCFKMQLGKLNFHLFNCKPFFLIWTLLGPTLKKGISLCQIDLIYW